MAGGAYVMFGDLRMQVTRMALAGGNLELLCQADGPIAGCDEKRTLALFGDDGLIVCNGNVRFVVPDVGPGEVLDFHFTIGMPYEGEQR